MVKVNVYIYGKLHNDEPMVFESNREVALWLRSYVDAWSFTGLTASDIEARVAA